MRIAVVLTANGRRGVEFAALLAQAANEAFLQRAKAGWWARFGRASPLLYESGIRYAREDRCSETEELRACSEERFVTIPELYRIGVGDCDDLAAAYAAEARILRGDRGARVHVIQWRSGHYHVVVRLGDGTLADPSARLGMNKGADAKPAKADGCCGG